MVCLGAFFLSLAPLVRFYVADQMVKAPLNHYQTTRLEAKNASYFDMATLKIKTGATLRASNTVRGDVRANGGDGDIAVWDSSTNIVDVANPEKPIQMSGYRIAFDRQSSQLMNCCGSNVDGDNSVKMSGYALLFPIANVQKRDYPFFDMTTRQSVPMTYSGEEEVRGIKTYRFVQRVPNTKTSALDVKLPARMLGMDPGLPDQQVDRYSTATVTMWVDPRTGVPVRHRQMINSTVQTADGRGRMTVAAADLMIMPESEKALADKSESNALKIDLARSYVPVGTLFLGLILLLAGGIIGLLGSRAMSSGPPAPRGPDGRFGDARAGARGRSSAARH
jgi:hypothetical protein